MADEIVIKMNNANEPPNVKINGKKIKGIVSLEYSYEISNTDNNGKHLYTIGYFDKESNSIRQLMVSKLT